jgi:predicted nucleic acid-binding protein
MQNEGNKPSRAGDYVLDSYALLAYLEAEPGSDRVRDLIEMAQAGKIHLYICAVNLGEVVYIIERERGLSRAQEILAWIDELAVEIVNADRVLALAAAHLKADCPLAYADCFAAALSLAKGACLVTGDSEFRKIKPGHNIRIEWLGKRG